MKDSRTPCFPFPAIDIAPHPNWPRAYKSGLTQRQFFAAMALQGMLAHEDAGTSVESMATSACIYADALIEALDRTDADIPKNDN